MQTQGAPKTLGLRLGYTTAYGEQMSMAVHRLGDGRYQLWYRLDGECYTHTYDTLHQLYHAGHLDETEWLMLGTDIAELLYTERQGDEWKDYDIHVILNIRSPCPCSEYYPDDTY